MSDLRYLPICEPCIRGEGSECHTPECALFLRDVPPDGLIAEFATTPADVLAGKSLTAYTADVRRAVAEEIATAIEEECPHEDEHPEGCCDLCDYAFAAAERAREIGEQGRPRRQVPSPVDSPTMHHRIARSLASPTDRDG